MKQVISHAVVICGDCDVDAETTEEPTSENQSQDNKDDTTNTEETEPKGEKEKNTFQASQINSDKDEVVEVDDDGGEFTLVKVYKNKKAKIDATEEVSDKEETKICSFYIQFRCMHGTWGKNCNFAHPKLCREFMKKGEAGCDLKDQCDYLHPKMCSKSMKGEVCSSLKCHLGHIKGTRDIKEAPTKKAGKEISKEAAITKKDFRKETVINSKLIKEIKTTSPTSVTPSPEISGIEALMKSMTALQEQLTLIQRDRETGREEIRSLWAMIQSKTSRQDPPPPALPVHHHQQTYSQSVMGTQHQKGQESQGCCRQSPQ